MVEFFSKLDFLSHRSQSYLKKHVIHSFEKKMFKINQVIYKQGEESNFVYIVHTGDFEVLRANKLYPMEIDVNEHPTDKVRSMLGPNRGLNKQTDHDSRKEASYKSQLVRVALLSKWSILGHEDVLNTRDYTTTCVCKSHNAQVYMCEAAKFHNLISRDPEARRILLNIVS